MDDCLLKCIGAVLYRLNYCSNKNTFIYTDTMTETTTQYTKKIVHGQEFFCGKPFGPKVCRTTGLTIT